MPQKSLLPKCTTQRFLSSMHQVVQPSLPPNATTVPQHKRGPHSHEQSPPAPSQPSSRQQESASCPWLGLFWQWAPTCGWRCSAGWSKRGWHTYSIYNLCTAASYTGRWLLLPSRPSWAPSSWYFSLLSDNSLHSRVQTPSFGFKILQPKFLPLFLMSMLLYICAL